MLSTYSERFGLDCVTTLKISSAFGAGIGRMGEICGAVSGAIMVIGLKSGMAEIGDYGAKEKTYGIAGEFIKRFKADRGSIICRELQGFDLSTPEGLMAAAEEGVFEKVCYELVRYSVGLLKEML